MAPPPILIVTAIALQRRLAPSACNRQPCKLVIVRDAKTRARIANACHFVSSRSGRHHLQKWVAEAPIVIVACGLVREANMHYRNREGEEPVAYWEWDACQEAAAKQPGDYESTVPWDLAIALDHLSLAACAEGLGTCWLIAFDKVEIHRILAIPEQVRAPIVMTLGYPTEWPDPRPRKPLSELVCHKEVVQT